MQLRISPCLWFDTRGEEAARFYVSVFPNSKVVAVTHYSDAGQEVHGKKVGEVMMVVFELDGQRFTALNGGPHFTFNEAISFEVHCDTQAEIDSYWEKLSAGGDPKAQQCGWLKDQFGVSWQVVPRQMGEWFKDSASDGAKRAMTAMLTMKKLDIAELKKAYAG
jgi:predicted 3-demethylubiquinone-9 3-methyltransferase (glyoxalase superfamily)